MIWVTQKRMENVVAVCMSPEMGPLTTDANYSMDIGCDIHNYVIAQWKTDDQVAVIGHHCEHGQFSKNTDAFPEGNNSTLHERVGNPFWYSRKNMAEIQGEMSQEKVLGGIETLIHRNGDEDEKVAS